LRRAQLAGHPALAGACDLGCGRDVAPREAAGEEREGLKLEAVLLVALDIRAVPVLFSRYPRACPGPR